MPSQGLCVPRTLWAILRALALGIMAVETIGAVTATSSPTDVTSGAANTKGSWVQLVASSAANADGIILITGQSTADSYLLDIGVGAAASESVVVSNVPVHERASSYIVGTYFIPVSIPAGSRVSARCQAGGSGSLLRLIGYLVTTTVPISSATTIATYGDVTASSRGTQIDPGGVANTKGSWVEITSSLSADVKFIVPMFANLNGARATYNFLVDIGTGGEGGESVVIADLYLGSTADNDELTPQAYPPLPVTIASGTRVAVRAQCNGTDATDRLIDFIMITANGTAAATGGLLTHPSMSGGLRG